MPILPGTVDFIPSGGGSPISSITGGDSFAVVVILDTNTTSALNVTLSIPSNTSVDIPGSSATPAGVQVILTVAANSDRVSITCSSNTVSSSEVVRFTATANGGSAHSDLTVTP